MESNAQWDLPATRFVRKVLGHPERFMPHVVVDDSLSPSLRQDDVVVIDTHVRLTDTGIFLVKVAYGVALIRLQRKEDGAVLAIRDFPEKDVFGLDGEPEIIGQVVLTLRKL